jgi:hypothetical protein
MECRPAGLLRLEACELETLAHFSVSSAMSLAKSAGELISISLPSSAIRALTAGSASTALTSRLSRARLCPRHLRHEQPVGHALLEMAEQPRSLGFRLLAPRRRCPI